ALRRAVDAFVGTCLADTINKNAARRRRKPILSDGGGTSMKEQDIHGLAANVKDGKISRRAFLRKMAAAGIAAPFATQILIWNDVAMADATLKYKPTKAGGGGPLKMLLWQAPTLLNPHFASGTKDQIASRIFYEPLAGWDKEGNLI